MFGGEKIELYPVFEGRVSLLMTFPTKCSSANAGRRYAVVSNEVETLTSAPVDGTVSRLRLCTRLRLNFGILTYWFIGLNC